MFGQVNTRYGDLNYAHAGGETGPVFDLWPGMSLTPALGAAVGYFDDRFYYGEGSGSATFEGRPARASSIRCASAPPIAPMTITSRRQEGWYYDIRGRVAIPKVFGDGNLIAFSPWVLWSDISGAVTNTLVTEIQPGTYREVGGRIEFFQQITAWMTVGASLAASWRDYSNDYRDRRHHRREAQGHAADSRRDGAVPRLLLEGMGPAVRLPLSATTIPTTRPRNSRTTSSPRR